MPSILLHSTDCKKEKTNKQKKQAPIPLIFKKSKVKKESLAYKNMLPQLYEKYRENSKPMIVYF